MRVSVSVRAVVCVRIKSYCLDAYTPSRTDGKNEYGHCAHTSAVFSEEFSGTKHLVE